MLLRPPLSDPIWELKVVADTATGGPSQNILRSRILGGSHLVRLLRLFVLDWDRGVMVLTTLSPLMPCVPL